MVGVQLFVGGLRFCIPERHRAAWKMMHGMWGWATVAAGAQRTSKGGGGGWQGSSFRGGGVWWGGGVVRGGALLAFFPVSHRAA
jgi:hypothetical protein